MIRLLLLVLLLITPLGAAAQDDTARALGRVTYEEIAVAGVTFDPAQSRGVFVGVNLYTATVGRRPGNLRSCVNDAVDLAAAFVELGLITPSGVVLVLSGEPSKPESVAALARLLAGGAKRTPDATRSTIDFEVSNAAAAAGTDGILFLTWSAHGFEVGERKVQYLTPADFFHLNPEPSTAEIVSRSLSETHLMTLAEQSPARRRVLIFDACRETRGLEPGIPELIASAAGMITLYAVTSGEMALEGARNGAFTSRLLDILRSPAPDVPADSNGHITIGTLLDHLGKAGRIEDTTILRMPLRVHPLHHQSAVKRREAAVLYRLAKQADDDAPAAQRLLEAISLSAVEAALQGPQGNAITDEIFALLDTPEKRVDFRNRRSFAAAWQQMEPGHLSTQPPVPPRQPPTATPRGESELERIQRELREREELIEAARAALEVVEALEGSDLLNHTRKADAWAAYISEHEGANHQLAHARERERYWRNWTPPTATPTPSPSPSPSPVPAEQRSSDGRYIKTTSTGVITDTTTNLQWIVGPDRHTNYNDAVAWVRNCTVDGGGWRMPRRTELRALYEKDRYEWPKPKIDPLFALSSRVVWVWAEERDSSNAWSISFFNGGDNWYHRTHSTNGRVLGVRDSPRR